MGMGIYKYKIQLIIRILLHYRLFILKSASFDIFEHLRDIYIATQTDVAERIHSLRQSVQMMAVTTMMMITGVNAMI